MEYLKDILFDDTGDLAWVDGDLVWDASDDQHIQDILSGKPGDYVLYPLVGCNVRQMIHGNASNDFLQTVRTQLIADGYEVNKVDYADGALSIDCNRKSTEEPVNGDGNADVNINITVQDILFNTTFYYANTNPITS